MMDIGDDLDPGAICVGTERGNDGAAGCIDRGLTADSAAFRHQAFIGFDAAGDIGTSCVDGRRGEDANTSCDIAERCDCIQNIFPRNE